MVTITTACGHCGQPLHMTVNSDMRYQVREQDAEPLVFLPQIDWTNFTEPNIIDAKLEITNAVTDLIENGKEQ